MLGRGSDAVAALRIGPLMPTGDVSDLGDLVPTLVRLTSSQAGVPEGDPLTLLARVHPVTGESESRPATGTVLFRIGGRLLGTATLDGAGEAVLDGLLLPVGVHAVIASYAGDTVHAAASSLPLPQAVAPTAVPVVVRVARPARTLAGVALEADLVDAASGRSATGATGRVVFYAGGTPVGSAELVAGHALVVVPHVLPGPLSASFPGDSEHGAAVGAA